MSHNIKCSECTSQFTQRKNLYAHLRKCHAIEPIFSRKSEPKFRCSVCSKLFSYKSTLVKHSKLHNTGTECAPRTSRLLCPQGECDKRFVNYALLRRHLSDKHCVTIEEENLEFDLMENFETWKNTIQQENSSLYTRDSSPKPLSALPFSEFYVQKLYYNCHRSHFFRPMGKGVRCLKSMGSNKIGKACPSRMEVSIIQSGKDLLVKVKFWKTHCGHELQLDRISLASQTRAEIADKLQEGESFDQILNSIKNVDAGQKDINPRLFLLNRKDLHNIVRDFNIEYSSKRNENNAVSELPLST